LTDPPQSACFGTIDMLSEYTPEAEDRKNVRRADLRFAIGVTVALALPVLISVSVYVATSVVLKVN
jgi:hypothetical protein